MKNKLAAAGCAAIRLILQQPGLREKLKKNAGLIRKGIRELEFITSGESTPNIPVIFTLLMIWNRTLSVYFAYYSIYHLMSITIDVAKCFPVHWIEKCGQLQ
jgi:hypothetical protein